MSGDYQIEMLWDCEAGHRGNLGRFKECPICGRPKREEDEFYMPGDTSRQAEVTDSELLRHALAGADWHCRYCDSSQRKLDGSCAQCGSDQSETTKEIPEKESLDNGISELIESFKQPTKAIRPPAIPAERLAPRLSVPPSVRPNRTVVVEYDDEIPRTPFFQKWMLAIPGVAILLGLLIWAIWPREYDAVVTDVYFQHAVHVEKYQVIQDQGWDYPGRAFDVKNEGQRIHHHDKVEDGWEKEYYNDRVPDGQDCHTTPVRVTKGTCRSNKNGFATCSSDTRSGGDRVCTTKYKTVQKWRKKTKYKDVPRYREWYSWKAWEWRHNRDVFETGHSLDVIWPSEEKINLCGTCTEGEQERITKDDRYSVKFTDTKDKDDSWNYTPSGLTEFKTFPVGTKRRIKVTAGMVELLPTNGK